MSNLNEEQLKSEAQKRVDFKRHLLMYVMVITLLWVIWVFSGSIYLWPVWPTGGWGIAVLFHYIGVYHPFQLFSVEKEIGKLKQEEN